MRRARVNDIITIASVMSGVDHEDIRGKKKSRRLVRIRWAIVVVARMQRPRPSYPEIGRLLGGRDHTTLVHGFGQSLIERENDPKFDEFIVELARRTQEAATFYVPPKAKPREVKFVPFASAVKPKNDFRPGEDDADGSHRFHNGIAKGSKALIAALRSAA